MLVRESVCLLVCTYQCGSCWMDLCEIWFWALSKNCWIPSLVKM